MCSGSEPLGKLCDGARRLLGDPLRRLAPKRMLDDEEREVRHPEAMRRPAREGLKGGRGNDHRGDASPLKLNGVVETPRRARASVGGAGDHQVRRLERGEHLRRRRRGEIRLLPVEGSGYGVPLTE